MDKLTKFIKEELIPVVGGLLVICIVPLAFIIIWGSNTDLAWRLFATDLVLIVCLFVIQEII